jgi:hypothetical protein
MIKQRLVNCDFLNVGGFLDNISNKAKLLYFMFIVNADDMGFVGNGVKLAKGLDECEENFDNTLFSYKYLDAINELNEKGFVYMFSDKHNNKTFLIRHWFKHNKYIGTRATNFISYLSKVEIVNGEYEMKNHKEKEPLKENEIKGNENKTKNHNSIKKDFIDSRDAIVEKENKEKENDEWDDFLKELNEMPNNND